MTLHRCVQMVLPPALFDVVADPGETHDLAAVWPGRGRRQMAGQARTARRERDGDELQGFMIAGKDHQWRPARARIEGTSVVVSSADVPQPAAVRYA